MEKNLRNKVVVITGASSGNGKACALQFAKAGAHVVLAARRENLLYEVASECEKEGVKALVVRTDVSLNDEVQNLFQKAQSLNGSIDIWVNNAGVLAMGSFEDTPLNVSEKILQTNLFSVLYSSHYLIPYFKKQGHGIMINMNSLSAYIPTPYVAAYSASKMGLKGFTEAIRHELIDEKKIRICDIFATFLDTTGMDHAANFTGVKLAPPPPVLDPLTVAKKMVELALDPQDETTLGSNAYLGRLARMIAPKTLGKTMAKLTKAYMKRGPKERDTKGNVLDPVKRGWKIHGGWKFLGIKRGTYRSEELQ